MTINLGQRIRSLENKIQNLAGLLNQSDQILADLEKNHQIDKNQIQQKEKELEDWRAKLELCQQERNQIKGEIKDKRLELEKSNLSSTEKQEKINKLLTENSEELEKLDNLLYEERTQYRNIRNKVINELCKPCLTCQSYKKSITYLFVTIGTMLFLFFIFHVWFIRWAWNKKKKKTGCCVHV